MANEGTLLTAAATLVAGAAFALAALRTRPEHSGRQTGDISLFFAISTAYLFVAGLRQVAAFVHHYAVDEALFYIVVVPAATAVIPLAHLTVNILGLGSRARRIFLIAYSILVMTGVLFVYVEGITGPHVSDWGTEWSINSAVTRVILVFAIVLPALFGGAVVLRAAGRGADRDAMRLRRVGLALLVYYIVFLLDALALPGAFLVVERLITAAAALYVYAAYR